MLNRLKDSNRLAELPPRGCELKRSLNDRAGKSAGLGRYHKPLEGPRQA
jgi:hypothetical protein